MTALSSGFRTSFSEELEMLVLHESLARERMREHERSLDVARQRQMLNRLAQVRRLQRRAESASRRARALLLSL
ncbi:MAG: hypothetical protein QOD07_1279 [Frankiaceae bacterium]|jgi:hypothetical protein|nr:hypothetical protein [Frankiaceae bacterium]